MRRTLIAALVAGVLGGCVTALAVPHERSRESHAPAEPPLRRAPARRAAHDIRLVPLRGTVHIEQRRADPAGGPGWAVRTFVGRDHGPDARIGGRRFCVQLLRELDGEPGWIDGTSTFRPAGFDYNDAPGVCTSQPPGSRSPVVDMATLVAATDSATGIHLTRSVVWGLTGPGTRRVDVRSAGGGEQSEASPAGGFIGFVDPQVSPRDVVLRVQYQDGRTRDVPLADPSPGIPRGLGIPRPPEPESGPLTIEVRAPDPGGGVAWALGAVPGKAGGWCLSNGAGRVVGDRVGSIDFLLGEFRSELGPARCPDPRSRRAVDVGYSFGDDERPGASDGRGRVARRTLRGMTTVYGQAEDDVTAITIATPRDVRTLVPSARAHAFLAVYDGDFPTGEIVITAHFRTGTSRVVDRFAMGGL